MPSGISLPENPFSQTRRSSASTSDPCGEQSISTAAPAQHAASSAASFEDPKRSSLHLVSRGFLQTDRPVPSAPASSSRSRSSSSLSSSVGSLRFDALATFSPGSKISRTFSGMYLAFEGANSRSNTLLPNLFRQSSFRPGTSSLTRTLSTSTVSSTTPSRQSSTTWPWSSLAHLSTWPLRAFTIFFLPFASDAKTTLAAASLPSLV